MSHIQLKEHPETSCGHFSVSTFSDSDQIIWGHVELKKIIS